MTEKTKKERKVRKCDYLLETITAGAVGDKPDAWVNVSSGVFADTSAAERHIRDNVTTLEGKTLRIVKVCKQFTVKTVTTTKAVLDELK